MFLESSFPLWFQRFLWRVSTKTDRSELRNVTRPALTYVLWSTLLDDKLALQPKKSDARLKGVAADRHQAGPVLTDSSRFQFTTTRSTQPFCLDKSHVRNTWQRRIYGSKSRKKSSRFAAAETFKSIKILGKSKGGSLWTSELGLVSRT